MTQASTNIRNPKQWEPVTAPVQNRAGERSPDALRAVLAQFDVEANPRYRKTSTSTFCNIFVWDATRALHAEIPHWVEDAERTGGRRELNANATMDWLEIVGPSMGWREVDATEAGKRADLGHPTVAVWKNPTPSRSGHIAMLLSSKNNEIHIAQAGAHNLFDKPLWRGFSHVKPIRFFTHE